MLIWIASYPRTGNTFFRVLAHRVFGLDTWSLYDDRHDIGANPALTRATGHRIHGMRPDEFAAAARAAPELMLVKTHELPQGDDPAIYLVRDGRSACVSYTHYMAQYGPQPAALQEVVMGAVWPGPWMRHAALWALSARPRTLVVRFEALVAQEAETLEAIAEHIGLTPRRRASIAFAQLNRIEPRFFRSGSDESNIAELEAICPALYDALHGEVAERLGYPRTPSWTKATLRTEMRRYGAALLKPPAPAAAVSEVGDR